MSHGGVGQVTIRDVTNAPAKTTSVANRLIE
jgi:hypothetical protein